MAIWWVLYSACACALFLHLVAWGLIWARVPLGVVPLSWAWRGLVGMVWTVWVLWWL
jgi:hypothetical protein